MGRPPGPPRLPGTTVPVLTTEPVVRPPGLTSWQRVPALVLLAVLAACTPLRQSAPPVGLGADPRLEPALSGDGRLLASLLEQNGRTTVVLQERQSGRLLPLAHLQRNQPHRSPSLSWNGRYLALITQQGERRLAVIEDRSTGRLHPLPLPSGQDVQRLSLSPDATRVAIEVTSGGLNRVLVFDLRQNLEPDLPPGQRLSGGGVP